VSERGLLRRLVLTCEVLSAALQILRLEPRHAHDAHGCHRRRTIGDHAIDLSNTPGIHPIRVGTNHSTCFCYNHVSARHRGNLTNSFLTPRLSDDPGTSLIMIRTSHAACFCYDHIIRRDFLSFKILTSSLWACIKKDVIEVIASNVIALN
jgi:hypothetical protein